MPVPGVEQQIKHYATGRKCWYFCYDKVGAQASANLFSLVMTCRTNDVDCFEYPSYVFEHLPMATTLDAVVRTANACNQFKGFGP